MKSVFNLHVGPVIGESVSYALLGATTAPDLKSTHMPHVHLQPVQLTFQVTSEIMPQTSNTDLLYNNIRLNKRLLPEVFT